MINNKCVQREYKSRHDIVVKVNQWELRKKFKFHPSNKWYMHNPESVQKNETHKILWDFVIETNPQISVRRSDIVIVDKKGNLLNSGRCSWPQDQTEGKQKER